MIRSNEALRNNEKEGEEGDSKYLYDGGNKQLYSEKVKNTRRTISRLGN